MLMVTSTLLVLLKKTSYILKFEVIEEFGIPL